MIGGKAGTCHRIVGENEGLRKMPRRNRRNCFTGLRLDQNHDAVDEFQILADRLQRQIEPLRVHRQEHHLAQGRAEIMRRARGDVGERRGDAAAGLLPRRRAEALRRGLEPRGLGSP